MNRTEHDLRAALADPPGIDSAAGRVVTAVLDTEAARTRLATHRRNWVAVSASAVTIAAVAIAIAALNPAKHPNTAKRVAPAADGSTTPSTASPQTTITPQVALQTLISLLPSAGTTNNYSGGDSLGEASASLVYDDGHGAALVGVLVSYPFLYEGPLASEQGKIQRPDNGSLCSSQGVVQLHQPCSTLSDGTQIAIYQGDANIPGGATEWNVEVLRADGLEVTVSEWNAASEKNAGTTRAEPPFSISDLTTIVESGQWRAKVDTAVAQQAAALFTAQHAQ